MSLIAFVPSASDVTTKQVAMVRADIRNTFSDVLFRASTDLTSDVLAKLVDDCADAFLKDWEQASQTNNKVNWHSSFVLVELEDVFFGYSSQDGTAGARYIFLVEALAHLYMHHLHTSLTSVVISMSSLRPISRMPTM